MTNGRALRHRRARARALNRRTDGGTAVSVARTSRQRRVPGPTTGASADRFRVDTGRVPWRVARNRIAVRNRATRIRATRIRGGVVIGARQSLHELITHEGDRRRAHRHDHVATPGSPKHLAWHVVPGRYEDLVA